MCDKLVTKVNNIDTSEFVSKTKHDADKSYLEKKISDANKKLTGITGTGITEIEDKIPSISGLTTTTALTAVESEIPNVSNLIKKTDYNTKINEIEKKITDHDYDKYITIPEFNNLTAKNFAARLAQANTATKSDIANFVDKTDFDNKLKNLNTKINSNKTKIFTG